MGRGGRRGWGALLTVVQVSFCSLIKGIYPENSHVVFFILINSVLLNLLCVWITFISGFLSLLCGCVQP